MLYDKKWDKEVKVVDEVGQALLKAADFIEEYGWCQGRVEESDGRVCMLGAISYVTDGHWNSPYKKIASLLGVPGSVWNDRPERTAEEVTAFLRHAAYQ